MTRIHCRKRAQPSKDINDRPLLLESIPVSATDGESILSGNVRDHSDIPQIVRSSRSCESWIQDINYLAWTFEIYISLFEILDGCIHGKRITLSQFRMRFQDKCIVSMQSHKLPFPATEFFAEYVGSYHAIECIELEDDFVVFADKTNSGIQVCVGTSDIHDHCLKHNCFGQNRTSFPNLRPVAPMVSRPRVHAKAPTSVAWLANFLEHQALNPYCLARANCQHFVQDLERDFIDCHVDTSGSLAKCRQHSQ